MTGLYTTNTVRQIERHAMKHQSEWCLMQKAAHAIFRVVLQAYPNASHYLCVVGGGNNGGDALTVAALLKQVNKPVSVRMVCERSSLKGSADKAAKMAEDAGLLLQSWTQSDSVAIDALIIDGLIGIGLNQPCREPALSAIQWINQQPCPKVSVDLPSGINADTGCAMGAAVYADMTVTMIVAKLGLYMADGPDHAGDIRIESLGCYNDILAHQVAAQTLSFPAIKFPKRRKNSHKGDYGHVVIIGGNHGMAGAIAMASLAALRAGAGMVSAVVRTANVAAVLPVVPEAMVYGVEEEPLPEVLLQRANVVVIGPGLGEDDWAQRCFEQVMALDTVKVIDASALRLLAHTTLTPSQYQVLTPHPGEASALLDQSSQTIQSHRLESATAIQQAYGGVCVLKGVGTLIAEQDAMHLCPFGNPGMATAGMGDVLSGIIAGLLAQGMSTGQASQLGVMLHALAADKASQAVGETSLIARDVIDQIAKVLSAITDL